MSELDRLKRENEQLRKEKSAYQAQCEIFEDFISMARSPNEPEFIKSTLRKIIEISEKLTGAELGSLFLLDSDGVVVDSVLARGEVSPEIRSVLIGSVFKKGLAGWVVRNRTVGLISDTKDDERWLILPDQPYSIRSSPWGRRKKRSKSIPGPWKGSWTEGIGCRRIFCPANCPRTPIGK